MKKLDLVFHFKMEGYSERSDKLEKDSENICHPTKTVPYSSCYESLMEEERLKCEARELQSMAQSIREKFKEIVEEGLPVPNEGYRFSYRFRKAIVSARKGKISVSIEQLLKACEVDLEIRFISSSNLQRNLVHT